ncbi:MAG TPA: alpha/beta fold hydrolase [Ktedonobacterales bacterium]
MPVHTRSRAHDGQGAEPRDRQRGQAESPSVPAGSATLNAAPASGAASGAALGVCILIHGINGSPEDMDELGKALVAQGFEARNLLLPGHGTTLHDFARYGWDEWKLAVARVADEALATRQPVFVIGHSLGASLALAVASERPQLAGVVALCPPVRLYDPIAKAVAAARHVTPYLPAWHEDIRDRKGARLRYRREVYRWTSTEALHTLMCALPRLRRKLPAVTSPALIIAARHDHIVPVRDGREAFALLGSRRKELMVLHHSFHAVTKDVERHAVTQRVVAFCQAEAPRRPD